MAFCRSGPAPRRPLPAAVSSLPLAALAAALTVLLSVASPATAQEAPPAVHVIATGGTIASTPGGGLSGEALLAALPGLDTLASITVEEFSRVGSSQITPDHWLRLSRRIDEVFRERPALAGVVVTHGTDTMEETAFFLHLTVRERRPVVVTGSMRPARAIGAEGPANLWNAIRVAATPEAAARGTLVLLNDEIHEAARVTKTNTTRLDAFASPEAGPTGMADPDAIRFHHAPAVPPLAGAFDVGAIQSLPPVEIVYAYAGADGDLLRAAGTGGTAGVVVASVGRGNLPAGQRAAVEELVMSGVAVVVSSRVNGGRVPVGSIRQVATDGGPESDGAVFGAGSLNPQKARILLALGLTRRTDPHALATLFDAF